ncbi:MAG: hypothetical protein WCW01_06790 [Gammaproteobacteria bacterium]
MNEQLFKKTFRTRSPGKVILSGEHAVLCGAPALAMAVNRYATTSITEDKNLTNSIIFDSSALNFHSELKGEDLRRLRTEISKRYQEYLENKISIEQVLAHPSELLLYLLADCLERFSILLQNKISIKIESTIPLGSGMGSSAASIISLLHSLVNYFSLPLKLDDYFAYGREIENLQHGRSSGLDLYLAMHGGTVLFQDGRAENITNSDLPMFFVYSGQPECSTGASVNVARKYLADKSLVAEFSAVTLELREAFEKTDFRNAQKCIKANESLLERISVVPERVKGFIRKVEKSGMAAKICGAGAAFGNNAGILLVMGKNRAELESLIQEYNYAILDLKEEEHAVQII